MYCPQCFEEYRAGVIECPDCHVAVVPGSPPVSAAALDARRIAKRNKGLVFIGAGVLTFVGGGRALADALGLGELASAYFVVILSVALLGAGLAFYSGTKRPARLPDGSPQRQWDRL